MRGAFPLLVLSFTGALLACDAPNAPAPGGVTREEADALNDAAAMLDDSLPPPPSPQPAATRQPVPKSPSG
jgi:hypothetical protein